MNGVKIGNMHSFDDWGLILVSKQISTPEPQTNLVNVPMRDGSIDLTEVLTDDIKYNDRTITMLFEIMDSRTDWSAKTSAIQNYLHGKRLQIVFDDDCAFYYVGRLKVNEWSPNKSTAQMQIEATVEPFKYDIVSSAVDWEWDMFDFEEGIINETGELIVNGSTTITLICRRKRMFPVFTVSEDMTVTFDGEIYNLKAGSQKVYDIFLCEGENELTLAGNGTVSIDYIGGSL